MKKNVKIFGAALTALLAIALVSSCDTGSNEDPAPVVDGNTLPSIPLGTVSDWSIALGYQNTTTVPLSVAQDTANADAAAGGTGCMVVNWASSTDFRSCELYALLPEGIDYGKFDGMQFDVKLPASANFLLLMRNPDGGTTFKVWEDYVYRGTDESATYVWVTVKKPFADAVDTGWGPAADPADLQDWLTADKATRKQINLNPVLNVGGGGALDVAQVTYIDNVGFYKAGVDGAADQVVVAWDFEPAAN